MGKPLANNEGFAIAGTIYDPIGDCSVFLLKIDNNGEFQWYSEYELNEYEVGLKVFQYDNHFYVGGFRRINSTPVRFDVAFWKANAMGEFIEEIIVEGTEGFLCQSMVMDGDGFAYFTGANSLTTSSETFILKTDLTGEVDWMNIYNSDDDVSVLSYEFGNHIIVNANDELVVLSTLNNKKRLILYQVSKDGELLKDRIFGSINPDVIKVGREVKQEGNSGDYLVIGEQVVGDFFLARLPEDLEVSTEESLAQKIVKIFPNPTVNKLQIKISDSVNKFAFEVYDMEGKVVLKGRTNNDDLIDVHNLSTGTYSLVIKDGEGIIETKFIKL